VPDAVRQTLVVHYAEIATKGKNRRAVRAPLMGTFGFALEDVG